MEKKIPIYFDSVVVSSPFKGISDQTPNIGRLKVRVFTKYGNRNGSYITDAVADQLIKSATNGTTPVVGFFDPQTSTWASHSGPKLAKGYGYVENFIGWQPFEDTDGITRDYAVFSVILFTDYYEEAQKIIGQNQSMELDPESIQGDWAMIQNQEYFVYTTAKMLGFCIIGDHEPCFSVSSFFSKNDDNYTTQFQKFSSLLSDLKAKVEETEKDKKGGEQPMNEFENQEVVDTVETPVTEETEKEVEIDSVFEEKTEEISDNPQVEEVEDTVEETEPSDFEKLQQQYNDLKASYDELQTTYAATQEELNKANEAQNNANSELETLRNQVSELQNTISNYEAVAAAAETERKVNLLKDYEDILDKEQLTKIEEEVNNFSFEELDNKLAIIFAHKQINNKKDEIKKVPVLEPEQTQFSLLMEKYRKN